MIQQMFFYILQWWGLIFLIGLGTLPLTQKLFSSFADRGYGFSKIIGAGIVTYGIFLLATLHVLQFSSTCLWILFFSLTAINISMIKKDFILFVKKSFPLLLFEEVIFFLGITFWSYIRGFQPDIHGLEKFMDFGFVNSILRTTYFPPKDMWMTPLSINYYYFGHLLTATLTKMSNLPSFITFNLMIATLFACTFSLGFSLGGNVWYLFQRSSIKTFIVSGLLSALLLTFSGNLHTIYTLFTPYQNDSPVAPWQLSFSPTTFPNSYWYPNATRFIFHTIHEFPIYSFVVSDLHGHVLDIPFVLLTLAILLILFTTPQKSFKLFQSSIVLGILCGIMYMTNAWDGLIYLLFSTCTLLYKLSEDDLSHIFSQFLSTRFLFSFITLFVSFVVTSLPFSLFFKPFASQIGINCAPSFLTKLGNIGPVIFEKGYCQTSPWWQLLILYGFFLFWILPFFILLWKKKKEATHSIDTFILFLIILGIFLIISPEFIYLKDIYTTYFRANTMFKMVYQAFIILSLSSGYIIVRIFSNLKKTTGLPKKLFTLCYMLLALCILALVSIYPYFAITSYYGNLKDFQGLNGTKYLQTLLPSDALAINWLSTHIKNQPTILEAQGDSYTDYERISSNTGLPTVLGWTVHEWLWRGTYDVVPQRVADIQTLYESNDLSQTVQLIKKYAISLVYVGDMERTKYPSLDEKKFNTIGTIVYKNSSVTIYKVGDY